MLEVTGLGKIVTTPDAGLLEQPVVLLVIITEYVPETVGVKLATFPGLVAPAGTVHV